MYITQANASEQTVNPYLLSRVKGFLDCRDLFKVHLDFFSKTHLAFSELTGWPECSLLGCMRSPPTNWSWVLSFLSFFSERYSTILTTSFCKELFFDWETSSNSKGMRTMVSIMGKNGILKRQRFIFVTVWNRPEMSRPYGRDRWT